MQKELKAAIAAASKKLFGQNIEPELFRPDEQFGDYATNVAMQLAGKLGKKPREIAEALSAEIDLSILSEKPTVAGAGFINFKLNHKTLFAAAVSEIKLPANLANQSVVVEYSDPNPFKVLHVGHLYTSVVGDSVAKLLEAASANVHRVNFGGDVGLHVAKTMWGVIEALAGEDPTKLEEVKNRAKWLTDCYIKGNQAYENDAKDEIKKLNQRIYEIQASSDQNSALAKIYWTTRQWSYDYFEQFYKRIGSGFEKYYPESETVEPGMEAVRENLGKVFAESDGAIVFKGEVHNMHTRVFINSQGLPTYETKDVGLILKKWQDYHFDKSIVITANEIYEYMQVVLKAVEQFAPELVAKTTHITHGLVKLAGKTKMSSRTGNIVEAEAVLDAAKAANKQINNSEDEGVALAAVKYAFLKQRLGADIIFDPAESVSLEGNSGPYLQYAYVRARGILQKAHSKGSAADTNFGLDQSERSLARKISLYPEVVNEAVTELLPSHVTTYLYELAQIFNRFYETNRVVGDSREAIRTKLVAAYADVLKHGLGLLNIAAPEKM